ncbi:MAG TPA: methionine adenosyltransferase [Flavobacteriaceae bacterium]|nr:methionine adenosyltransferase [Flavobacteriaceae bacterium]
MSFVCVFKVFYLRWENSSINIWTLVTSGQVILAGEIRSKAELDYRKIARQVINKAGYTKASYKFTGNSCGILSAIHGQSADINQGVSRKAEDDSFEAKAEAQGAGDQGMMFGYATSETSSYMPLALELAHEILKTLSEIRREGKQMTYLGPDSKSQVTIEYSDDHQPTKIKTIVVSTQHDEFASEKEMIEIIRDDVENILIPRVKQSYNSQTQKLFTDDIKYLINPTGKFVIGGPHGDTGLTGRKIIVDTYGGRGAHGGGAFSGKDPSKVDRSGAYATRHIAKNLVAAGIADKILVQVSYAIGVAEPTGLYINSYGTAKVDLSDGEIAEKVIKLFDLRPYAIEQNLKLRNPIYQETASYGHMGRKPYTANKTFNKGLPNEKTIENLEFFTWEKLDRVHQIKEEFGI